MTMNAMIRTTCLLTLSLVGLVTAADESVEFNRDIRAIFSDRCFACHGPDSQSREADLRLDQREAATDATLGAIVPGNASESEVIRRVLSEDESELMPPPGHGKPLDSDEIGILQRWINQGAKYQKHWSLTKIARPAVPKLPTSRAEQPVDAFIGRRLAAERLDFAAQAEPRTLVRRLSFDLPGLPPHPELVDRFVADPSDEAYSDLVDRLQQWHCPGFKTAPDSMRSPINWGRNHSFACCGRCIMVWKTWGESATCVSAPLPASSQCTVLSWSTKNKSPRAERSTGDMLSGTSQRQSSSNASKSMPSGLMVNPFPVIFMSTSFVKEAYARLAGRSIVAVGPAFGTSNLRKECHRRPFPPSKNGRAVIS